MNSTSSVKYSAESALRRPRQLFRQMFVDLWDSRELAWRLFIRDFSAQYRQTFLGFLWAFLPPLITTGVFVFLNRTGVLAAADLKVSKPLFIFVGMLYWQLFVDSLLNPSSIVGASRSMITKLDFPRESLVLAAIGQSLVSFIVRLMLLVVFCIWFRYTPPLSAIPAMLMAILPILTFGTCLGLLVLPLGLLFQDFAQAVTLGTTFILFITPVGYYIDPGGLVAWYFKINPLMYLVNFPRDIFFGLSAGYISIVLWVFVGSLIALMIGWMLFRLSLPIVFERLGA